jgi:gluconokinase
MRTGIPLDDDDRMVWFDSIHAALIRCSKAGNNGDKTPTIVLTCSCLKSKYRDILRSFEGFRCVFVYLNVSKQTAMARVRSRGGSHFFPAALVDSQFSTLELPSASEGDCIVLDNNDNDNDNDSASASIPSLIRAQLPAKM